MRVNLTIISMIVVDTWLAYKQTMQEQAGGESEEFLHISGRRTHRQPFGCGESSRLLLNAEKGRVCTIAF